MALSQTTVTGSFRTAADADARVTDVIFKLSGSDFENGEGITTADIPSAVITEDGDFEITLWPNDRGVYGDTRYSVEYRFDDGSFFTVMRDITVPYSPSPWTLEDLAYRQRVSARIAPAQFFLLTAGEFEDMQPKPPGSAFQIRG